MYYTRKGELISIEVRITILSNSEPAVSSFEIVETVTVQSKQFKLDALSLSKKEPTTRGRPKEMTA